MSKITSATGAIIIIAALIMAPTNMPQVIEVATEYAVSDILYCAENIEESAQRNESTTYFVATESENISSLSRNGKSYPTGFI